MITTGIKDQRVVAWDPAKFVARLQSVNQGKNPVVLRVNFNSGHGLNKSTQDIYSEVADIYSFALWQTNHPDYQPIPD